MRALAQSAFVEEDDRPAFVAFFLAPAMLRYSRGQSFLRPISALAQRDAGSSIATADPSADSAAHGLNVCQ
jgi:hypothetical protein